MKNILFSILGLLVFLFVGCDSLDPNMSLDEAAYKGKEKTVSYLIQQGADVNKKNSRGVLKERRSLCS